MTPPYFFRIVKDQSAKRAETAKTVIETRTTYLADLNNGFWWRMTGSNRRPPACKAGALPAELIPLLIYATVCENQAGQGGASRRLRFVGKRRDNAVMRRLSQISWWVWVGSNHRPPPYQDGALTS